jgi:hypothetical protein
MEVLEKAKIALRRHLLENRDRVAHDLDQMREKSTGGSDVINYIANLSTAFSFGEVAIKNNVTYQVPSSMEIDSYFLVDLEGLENLYSPPEGMVDTNKKDSGILTESFFL